MKLLVSSSVLDTFCRIYYVIDIVRKSLSLNLLDVRQSCSILTYLAVHIAYDKTRFVQKFSLEWNCQMSHMGIKTHKQDASVTCLQVKSDTKNF